MASHTVDLRGDASRGWGLPLPLLCGALSPPPAWGSPRHEPRGSAVWWGGHREAWIGLNLVLSSPLGNTVYQNVKLAPFLDQPDGILLCMAHSQIALALQSALAF